MLLETLVCSSSKLSQVFPVDKGLLRHYVPNSDTHNFHSTKLTEGYQAVGVDYTLHNKQLYENLDQLEDLLEKYPVTNVTFLSDDVIQILLNTATIVYVTIKSGELQDITIVHSLAKVLRGQLVFDGYITEQYMIMVCSGKLVLTTNSVKPSQFEKQLDYKILNLETDFCYEAYLSVLDNMVMLWTPEGNIVIYSPIGPGAQVLCRYTTPYRLSSCTFQPLNCSLITCQLKPSSQGNSFHAISISYDIVGRGTRTDSPLKQRKCRIVEILKHKVSHVRADVVCARYNHAADKLLLGLSNGKILLHCEKLKRNFSTDIKQAILSFAWHSSDSFLVVVMKSGYIQLYDETLQLITTSFGSFPESTNVDINRIFNNVRNVTRATLYRDQMAVMVERGPLLSMTISMPHTDKETDYFIRILKMYIYRAQYRHASRLLRNCLYRFNSEEQLLHILTSLISELLNNFTEMNFSIGAELMLQLSKEKVTNRELLDKLAIRIILRGLHNKLYRETLKLARKLDNPKIIGLVDKYVKFCGLSVTCKSPEQIKLTRKPTKSK